MYSEGGDPELEELGMKDPGGQLARGRCAEAGLSRHLKSEPRVPQVEVQIEHSSRGHSPCARSITGAESGQGRWSPERGCWQERALERPVKAAIWCAIPRL